MRLCRAAAQRYLPTRRLGRLRCPPLDDPWSRRGLPRKSGGRRRSASSAEANSEWWSSQWLLLKRGSLRGSKSISWLVRFELQRRPWQSVRTASHVQPRERIREDVGGRVRAGFPELYQLLARLIATARLGWIVVARCVAVVDRPRRSVGPARNGVLVPWMDDDMSRVTRRCRTGRRTEGDQQA